MRSIDSLWILRGIYALLLHPFLQVPLAVRLGRFRELVSAWFGATLAGMVGVPVTYAMAWMLQLIPGLELVRGSWSLVRTIATVWGMSSGAASAMLSFPGDDLGGGRYRMSAVAVTAGATTAFMMGLAAAPLVKAWYWSCLVGALGAIFVGGMWGGIIGDPLGRFLRELVGLAEGEFEGIRGLGRVSVALEDATPEIHEYRPSPIKLLIMTAPCWLIVCVIGQDVAVWWATILSIGWISWQLIAGKTLEVSRDSVRVKGQTRQELRWEEIERCAIDREEYRLHFIPRSDVCTPRAPITWGWLWALSSQQRSLVSQLRLRLGEEALRMVPAPIPTRQRIRSYLDTVERALATGSVAGVIAPLHAASEMARDLGAIDLLIEAMILDSEVEFNSGAFGLVFESADRAIQQAEAYGDPQLLARALVNKVRLLAQIAPRMRLIDDLVKQVRDLGTVHSPEVAAVLEEIYATRLVLQTQSKDVIQELEGRLRDVKSVTEETALRRARAEALLREAELSDEASHQRILYARAASDYEWLLESAKHTGRAEEASLAWCWHCLGDRRRARSRLQALVQDSRKTHDLLGESSSLWRRALIDIKEGDWETAYRDLRSACDRIESIHRASRRDWQKIVLLSSQRQWMYEDMVGLCLEMPSVICDALRINRTERAFEYVERSKSRALLDLIGSQRLRQDSSVSVNVSRVSSRAPAYLPRYGTAVQPSRAQHFGERDNWLIGESQIQSLETVSTVGINLLQKHLSPDCGLLEYYKIRGQWAVFVITHDTCRHHWITLDALGGVDLEKAVRKFTEEVSHCDYSLYEGIRKRAQQLHEVLWKPIVEETRECRILYVVPHGPLHLLPFSALHNGQGWLVETDPPVAYAPSASILSQPRSETVPAEPRFVGFANPYDNPFLPNVTTEMQECARIYKDPITLPAKYGTNYPARTDFLRLAPSADVLHIACHGRLTNDPLESGFRLYGDHGVAEWVTTRDLLETQLKARLVVASICYGSAGRLAGGDEWLGLLRSFVAAGAHSVVASRWEIDDKASNHIMKKLHTFLKTEGVAKAVQYSAVDLMMDRRRLFEHPYYWSSIGVWGNGGRIRASASHTQSRPILC